jgi:hypothetical protein
MTHYPATAHEARAMTREVEREAPVIRIVTHLPEIVGGAVWQYTESVPEIAGFRARADEVWLEETVERAMQRHHEALWRRRVEDGAEDVLPPMGPS